MFLEGQVKDIVLPLKLPGQVNNAAKEKEHPSCHCWVLVSKERVVEAYIVNKVVGLQSWVVAEVLGGGDLAEL